VANASITAYIAQSSNILSGLPAKLASHNVIVVNNLSYSAKLIFAEFAGLGAFFNLGLLQNHFRSMPTYTMNIGQRNPYRFIIRNINTYYTGHISSLQLTLALFVPWVGTNHPHNTFATNNLAIFTYTFHRTSNFHFAYPI
jgi:hypothetical protein